MARARDIGERLFVRAVSSPRMSRVTASLADLRPPGPLLRAPSCAPTSAPTEWTCRRRRSRSLPSRASTRSSPGVCARARARSARTRTPSSRPATRACTRSGRAGGRPARADQGPHVFALRPPGIGGRRAHLRRGVHATLYLSPSMYHRVHSPVDGLIRAWRYVPGRLFPVNGLAIRHVNSLFAVNERVSILIDSPEFGRGRDHGGRGQRRTHEPLLRRSRHELRAAGRSRPANGAHPHRARPGAGRVQPRLDGGAARGGSTAAARGHDPWPVRPMGSPLWRRTPA